MSWTHVQGTGNQNSGSSTQSLTCSYGSNVTAGNLLVAGVVGYQPVNPSVSDNHNAGSWSQAVALQYGTTCWVGLYYILNTYSGALTVTFSGTSGVSYPSMSIDEYSFGGGVIASDGSASADGSSTSAATSAIAPTGTDLVYAVCGFSGSTTATPSGNARYMAGLMSGKAYGICAQDWLNQLGSVTPSVSFGASLGWNLVATAFRPTGTVPPIMASWLSRGWRPQPPETFE